MKENGNERSKVGDRPGHPAGEAVYTKEERIRARKAFSTLGFGCFVFLALSSVVQVVGARLLPGLASTSWGIWLFDLVPMYAIALPVSLLIFFRVPARKEVGGSKTGVPLKAGQIVRAVVILVFLTNAGNLVGILVTNILGALAGTSTDSPIGYYTVNTSVWLQILFMAIVGPLFEELIYRKLLIDRMSCYGGQLAVVVSALMFALSHGNLSQFFYAFALGLVNGYIYLKTGRLRYSAGLHMSMNLLGVVESFVALNTVILPEDISHMTGGQVLELVMLVVVIVAVVAATIIGLVLFNRARKRVSYTREERQVPKGFRFRTACCNAGMAVFVLGCAGLFAVSLFA